MGFFYPFSPRRDIATASNVRIGTNPAYTSEDFYNWFPAFRGQIEPFVINQFIAMANSTVQEVRWHSDWLWGMGYFIAHFATVFLRTQTATPDPTALQIVKAGQIQGLMASKSVGDVSASYDYSVTTAGIEGWANYGSTSYGIEFAKRARLLGRGPMYVQ